MKLFCFKLFQIVSYLKIPSLFGIVKFYKKANKNKELIKLNLKFSFFGISFASLKN